MEQPGCSLVFFFFFCHFFFFWEAGAGREGGCHQQLKIKTPAVRSFSSICCLSDPGASTRRYTTWRCGARMRGRMRPNTGLLEICGGYGAGCGVVQRRGAGVAGAPVGGIQLSSLPGTRMETPTGPSRTMETNTQKRVQSTSIATAGFGLQQTGFSRC